MTTLTVEGGIPEEFDFLPKLGKLKILKIKNVQLNNLEFLQHLTKLEEFEMHKPAKNEAGIAYNNNGQFEVFKDTKLNSFMVLCNGETDIMEEAKRIEKELKTYGLKITSYGSVG